MNKKEYLESCIANLNEELKSGHISRKLRKNKEYALMFYKNDLERENAFEQLNSQQLW